MSGALFSLRRRGALIAALLTAASVGANRAVANVAPTPAEARTTFSRSIAPVAATAAEVSGNPNRAHITRSTLSPAETESLERQRPSPSFASR